ncbi:MAG: extracellular solute-binding protein [Propionibacteriaceae bacterium]|nr:extracellular solute-binding protein [Propionibacteriaceae bacterium]
MPELTSLSRRRLLQAAGLGVATTTLGACAGPGAGGPSGDGKSGDTATKLDPTKASGSISFAHWRGEDKAAFDEVVAKLKESYPDVEVRQDISPSNDYQSNALAQVRQGTVGDLFASFRGAQLTAMKDADLLVDLTDTGVAGKYEESLISEGIVDGKTMALPYQLVFNQPITNEKLLEKAGATELPADWDAYLSLLEAIKGLGIIPIAWPGGEMGNAGQLFNSMIMNVAPADDMCSQIEEGKLKCTDDWFIQMLRHYEELKPYFQDNPTGTAVEPAEQMFASEQAAMLATGSYHVAAVRGLGGAFPIGMLAPITASAGKSKYVGVHNATFALGVSSVSKNPDTAFALLNLLSDPKVAGVYGDATAQFVTVKDVKYANKDLSHLSEWVDKKTLLAPRFQFNNLDIRNAAEGACIAVVGGKSPEEAAEEAQAIIDQQIGN